MCTQGRKGLDTPLVYNNNNYHVVLTSLILRLSLWGRDWQFAES